MFKLELSYTDILKRVAVFIVIALSLNIIIFQLTPFLLAALIAIILERPVALLAKKNPQAVGCADSLNSISLPHASSPINYNFQSNW